MRREKVRSSSLYEQGGETLSHELLPAIPMVMATVVRSFRSSWYAFQLLHTPLFFETIVRSNLFGRWRNCGTRGKATKLHNKMLRPCLYSLRVCVEAIMPSITRKTFASHSLFSLSPPRQLFANVAERGHTLAGRVVYSLMSLTIWCKNSTQVILHPSQNVRIFLGWTRVIRKYVELNERILCLVEKGRQVRRLNSGGLQLIEKIMLVNKLLYFRINRKG